MRTIWTFRIPRIPPEEQKSRSESVQPVDGSQVLQALFLGQNEDYGVVAIAAARVNLQRI